MLSAQANPRAIKLLWLVAIYRLLIYGIHLPWLFDLTRTDGSMTGLEKWDRNPQPGCSLFTRDVSIYGEANEVKFSSEGCISKRPVKYTPNYKQKHVILNPNKRTWRLRQVELQGLSWVCVGGERLSWIAALWVIKHPWFWSAEHLMTLLPRQSSS